MEQIPSHPIHVHLPGMEVYLTRFFFKGLERPRFLHTHPSYELICIDDPQGMKFHIIPPLVEHLSVDAPNEQVSSILFSPSQEDPDSLTGVFWGLKEPMELRDAFDGRSLVRSLKKELVSPGPGAMEQVAAELRLLFVRLARAILPREHPYAANRQTLDEERLAQLEEYFNMRLRDPNCSKQHLASCIGVSERQLSRILDEVYHSNFSSILLQSRMNLAAAMVQEGRSTLQEIAEAVGYVSVDSFKQAYRRYFGHSPRNK